MHTLPVRDAVPSSGPLSPLSPKVLMVLQYNSCTGEVVPRSSSLPTTQVHPDMRDVVHGRLSGRQTSQAGGIGGHRPSVASVEDSVASKRRGAIGSVVRRLFPHRQERSLDSIDPMLIHLPTAQQPAGRHLPGPSYRHHAASTARSASLSLQNPMAAHPLAVADAGDTAARVNKFLSQKTALRHDLALYDLALSSPLRPREETWYDTREISLLSNDEEDIDSERVAIASVVSSSSIRRRSRSVGGMSEFRPKSSHSRLRPQKSDRNLSMASATRLPQVGSSEEIGKTAYQSRSSGEPYTAQDPPIAHSPTTTPTPYSRQLQDSMASVQEETLSRVKEGEAAAASRKTFDFDSLLDSMTASSQINVQGLAERMATYEVKQMDLEYSISKLQSQLPPGRPVIFRPSSTHQPAATGPTQQPQAPVSPLGKIRQQSPPLFASKTPVSAPTSPVKPLTGPQEARSSVSTILPSRISTSSPPISREGELSPSIVVQTSTQRGSSNRDSVTLMTTEHYSTLVNLLQRQQSLHKMVVEDVARLTLEKDTLNDQLQQEREARQRQDERLKTLESQMAALGALLQSRRIEAEEGKLDPQSVSVAVDTAANQRHLSPANPREEDVSSALSTESSPSGSGSESGESRRLQSVNYGARAVPPARRPSPASSQGTLSLNLVNEYNTPVEAPSSERIDSTKDGFPPRQAP